MSHPLVELSRTKNQTSSSLVFEDYDKHPAICRHGLWVGWKINFTETVLLAFQHDPEELYVGWAINGTTVVDPGYGTGTAPWGSPAPGESSVTYVTPVAGLFHQLSLTSTAGDDNECLWVQVLYRKPNEASAPAHQGPAMWVCLSGSEISWPADKLDAERRCLDRLRRYVEFAHVKPGDPVEQWLSRIRGEDALRIRAEIDTLEKLDPKAQPELAEAIKADLLRVAHARMPGSLSTRGTTAKPTASG
jgi:hypothetical protein